LLGIEVIVAYQIIISRVTDGRARSTSPGAEC